MFIISEDVSITPLKSCGYYTNPDIFNTHKSYVLPTQCTYILYVDLGKSSDFQGQESAIILIPIAVN